jgi:hypothetical protein
LSFEVRTVFQASDAARPWRVTMLITIVEWPSGANSVQSIMTTTSLRAAMNRRAILGRNTCGRTLSLDS